MKKMTIVLRPFALFMVFSALLCTAFAAEDSSKKYTLKFQYPIGEYKMTLDMDNDMVTEFSGQKMPMKQTQKQTFDLSVTEEGSDGLKRVTMELKRIQITTEMMGHKMSFDSDSEDDMTNSPLKTMAGMLNFKISSIYDKDNKVVKVEGLDEMWDKLGKDNPMIASMKDSMGDNAFMQNFDQAAARFPKNGVAVGESWKNEIENTLPILGKAKVNSENTLKSIEKVDGKDVATIETKEKISEVGESEMKMGPMKFVYKNVELKTDSFTKIDFESGMVTSTKGTTDMSADMEAQAPGGRSEKILMKMQGIIKMEMNVIPVKK